MTFQSSPIKRATRALLLSATCLWHASAAHAALSGDALKHGQSAFVFADRHDWSNAYQHATASHDRALIKLIRWQYLLDVDSRATFDEITTFVRENPAWPEQKKLAIRAEQAIRDSRPDDPHIVAWFEAHAPLTGIGKVAYAEALGRTTNPPTDKMNYLLRDAWRNGDFDENQEAAFLAAHSSVLTADDEFSRVDRLLWEDKTAPAERSLDRVNAKEKKMFAARIALQDGGKGVDALLADVPDVVAKTPGLLYDHIRYLLQKGKEDAARDIFVHLPDHLPYPEKWWKMREAQVRRAIDEKDYDVAQKLLNGHEQLSGNEFADASWLQGWLSLEFLKKPADARKAFEAMYDSVKFPVSKSRAGYWAARAATAAGDEQGAKTWYANAAAFPTTFYGQLASLKLSAKAPLVMPPAPSVTEAERKAFENSDMVQAVALSVQLGDPQLAAKLLSLIIDDTDDEKRIEAAAQFGMHLGKSNLSVRVAKKAMQQNIVLIEAGYPRPKIPGDLPVEGALALAIARQESEFDPQAKSRAGALGLMQLLPGTAKEIAKKAAVGFKKVRLIEPGYNVTLGSHYLARLVGSYNGSYIMAIAAYNAGPGNVRNWRDEFGAPDTKNIDAAVDWIEKIPFYETRNYVERVLENLQIYRQLEAGKNPQPLLLGDDMLR